MKRRKRPYRPPKRKPQKPAKKARWFKYALLPAALALGLAAAYTMKSDAPRRSRRQSAKVEKRKPKKRSRLTINYVKLKTPTNLQALDSKLSPLLRKTSYRNCPVVVRKRNDSPLSIKQAVSEINRLYFKNNVWVFFQSANRKNKDTGKVEHVTCVFRFPIKRKVRISFSLFGGKLSAKNIPGYVLGGSLFLQGTLVGGTVTRNGVVAFDEAIRTSYLIKKDTRLQDVLLHEAIHYHTMLRGGDTEFLDSVELNMDLWKNAPKSKTAARSRDELRAHLIQMIYGRHPQYTLLSLMQSSMKLHQLARVVVSRALEKYFLKNDPARYKKFKYERLSPEKISEKEIRRIAHRLFIKHKLWKL